MDEGQLRQRVAEARVARIGTLDPRGRVHLVPIVFPAGRGRQSPDDGRGHRPVAGWAYSD
ncbi:MAG TPA: hypothetical protein VFJ69_12080 [Actinomycetota bacterium]|nr:hypothetical protein [Actinomycetota bacterium]